MPFFEVIWCFFEENLKLKTKTFKIKINFLESGFTTYVYITILGKLSQTNKRFFCIFFKYIKPIVWA